MKKMMMAFVLTICVAFCAVAEDYYWVKTMPSSAVLYSDGSPAGTDQAWKSWETATVASTSNTNDVWVDKVAHYGLMIKPTRTENDIMYFSKFGKEWAVKAADLTKDPRQTFGWYSATSSLDGFLLGFTPDNIKTIRDAVAIAASTEQDIVATDMIIESLKTDGLIKGNETNFGEMTRTIRNAHRPTK